MWRFVMDKGLEKEASKFGRIEKRDDNGKAFEKNIGTETETKVQYQ